MKSHFLIILLSLTTSINLSSCSDTRGEHDDETVYGNIAQVKTYRYVDFGDANKITIWFASKYTDQWFNLNLTYEDGEYNSGLVETQMMALSISGTIADEKIYALIKGFNEYYGVDLSINNTSDKEIYVYFKSVLDLNLAGKTKIPAHDQKSLQYDEDGDLIEESEKKKRRYDEDGDPIDDDE